MSGLTGRISTSFSRRLAQELSPAPASGAAGGSTRPPGSDPAIDPDLFFACRGTLYVQNMGQYIPMSDLGGAAIELRKRASPPPTTAVKGAKSAAQSSTATFVISIVERATGEELLCQNVAEGTQLTYHYPTGSVMWPTIMEGKLHQFAFRFATGADIALAPDALTKAFVEIFNQCLYCALTGGPLPSATRTTAGGAGGDDEYDFVAGQLCSEAPIDEDTAALPAGSSPASRPPPPAEDRVPTYNLSRSSSTSGAAAAADQVNLCFADSVRYNRAIVMRKDGRDFRAQAFRYDADEEPQSFGVAATGLGGAPSQALLKGDELQLMLLAEDAGKIAQVDLTRGEVVQQYAADENTKIQSIAHADKIGAEDALMTCISHNGVFNIDTRLDPRKCVVLEPDAMGPRTYQRQEFTCHATSLKGHLALGNTKGEIKLFTGPPGARREKGGHFPKDAKTVLNATPGKEAIRHLDITGDGSYILATCEKFLLVLCTAYMEEGKPLNGFAGRMGKHKPSPVRLELSAAQIHMLGGYDKVSFQKATFETNSSQTEHWICSAMSDSIVTWSFDSVKQAIESRRAVVGDVADVRGDGPIRDVVVGLPTPDVLQVKFMTASEVGMAPTSIAALSRKGKQTLRFAA